MHAEIFLSGNRKLHLLTTHLQATPPSCEANVKYAKIRDSQVKAIRTYMDTLHKNEPEKRNPILLIGDLNIDSRNMFIEYKRIVDKYLIGFNDLLLPPSGIHNVTYGDGSNTIYGLPYEIVLTDPKDVGTYQTLDHAFLKDESNQIQIVSARVNPLCVPGKYPVSHISGIFKLEF